MNNTQIVPFGNNILIEPIEDTSPLGQQSLCQYGKVMAIGDEVKKIGVGDTIGFLVWGLNHLEIGTKRWYFVPENNEFILGKISL